MTDTVDNAAPIATGATVAIVGRPNVGKSSLFNRLVGQRAALVHDQPGVTRDRREGDARLGGLSFRIIDTAGLDDAGQDLLSGAIRDQTARAVADADVVLMMIDARAGITPLDRHFADQIRRRGAPVLVLANKAEGRASEAGTLEAFDLGLGEPIAVSAQHGIGMAELADALADLIHAAEDVGEDTDESDRPLHLAIVGRPNTGKSTLLNCLIGAERVLTGPEPGVTRDSIAVDWSYQGRAIRLVDTAGIRRRARVTKRVEQLSVSDSLRTIRMADVVALIVDATEGAFERQDLIIANRVIEQGRALIVAANKWDLVDDPGQRGTALNDQLAHALPQVRGVPLTPISAKTDTGIDRLMANIFSLHDVWDKRLPTAELNRWLEEIVAHHPPPLAGGRQVKIRYITQVAARPPQFVLFVNRSKALDDTYIRYLTNHLRSAFKLSGTPIRIMQRSGRNPYTDKS